MKESKIKALIVEAVGENDLDISKLSLSKLSDGIKKHTDGAVISAEEKIKNSFDENKIGKEAVNELLKSFEFESKAELKAKLDTTKKEDNELFKANTKLESQIEKLTEQNETSGKALSDSENKIGAMNTEILNSSVKSLSIEAGVDPKKVADFSSILDVSSVDEKVGSEREETLNTLIGDKLKASPFWGLDNKAAGYNGEGKVEPASDKDEMAAWEKEAGLTNTVIKK